MSRSINGCVNDAWNGLVIFGVTSTGDAFKNGFVDGFVVILLTSALNSALNMFNVAVKIRYNGCDVTFLFL